MNKILVNQVWEVSGVRIIVGDVFPVSTNVFSTESGKMETWLQSDILLHGDLVSKGLLS